MLSEGFCQKVHVLIKDECIDAVDTIYSNGFLNYGRLINHSINGNIVTSSTTDSRIHGIVFKTGNKPLKKGEELRYDYGERRKTAIQANPWLLQV